MALKIIDLLKLISGAIDEGDGIKLEKYSLIMKEFMNKFLLIKKVISSFERNCFVYSVELEKFRALAVAQHDLIISRDKNNRNRLKISLKKISTQIDQFSGKILYSAPFSRQSVPQFVDLNI